ERSSETVGNCRRGSVSWLTSLLHADTLSSRFDQQANSLGSWTKLALNPQPIALQEDPECFFGNLFKNKLISLAQLAPPLIPFLPRCFVGAAPDWMFQQEHLVTKMDQVLMSCDNVLEEKHQTKHAGLVPAPRCGGLLTGHSGIHWLSLFNTRTCRKITRCERCHLGQQRRSEGDVVKFLGLILDEHLNWNAHIHHVFKKLAPLIGALYGLQHILSSNAKKSIYFDNLAGLAGLENILVSKEAFWILLKSNGLWVQRQLGPTSKTVGLLVKS
ncbi:7-methyl-GTP pyrophosphatase, partial [Frankliniella fusca]